MKAIKAWTAFNGGGEITTFVEIEDGTVLAIAYASHAKQRARNNG